MLATSSDDRERGERVSILDRLRQETRPQHLSIERLVPLLQEDLTLEGYRGYLRKQLGFYRPLEALLDVHLGALSAFEPAARRKLPWLEQDLLRLGETEAGLLALPVCRRLPHLAGAPEALGCLYVLEGSTLGGQILLRRVIAGLGLAPDRGASYLAAYGQRTGEMWRRFGGALTAYASQHGGEDRMVRAAQQTFTALEAWLLPGPAAP